MKHMSHSDHRLDEQHADGIIENRERKPPVYFNILFFGLILWAVIFMAYYLFSGWSSDAEFQAKMEAHQQQVAKATPSAAAALVQPEKLSLEAGKKIFASHCAMCHGAEGKGGIGPNLTGEKFRYGRSEAAIHESISKGRPNGMPAFGSQLSGGDLANLVGFVLSLK